MNGPPRGYQTSQARACRRVWDERPLGPKLAGKLHIAVGDMDSYYLNNAVERMEAALADLSNPTPDVEFEYGRKKPHCWIGYSRDQPGEDLTNAEFVRIVVEHLEERGGRW